MNAIDALEHELVAAAERRAERRRTARVRRRWAPIAAAAAIALVGVPAWAAGLLGNVFPSSHDTPPGIGRSYTVASGMTSRGEPWRFELTRGTHFRNGAATGICFAFVVGTQPNGFGICAGGAPRTREPGTAFGTGQRVSRHDRRRLLVMTVPRGVALVRIRFHSGRTLSVRPLEIDRARAKATGVPFPLGVVLVAFAHHDSVLRVMPERAPGAPGGPLVRSPAL